MNSDQNTHLKLTDWLALERTKLANQRTLLAMLRTGLYFIVMGITVLSLPELKSLYNYYWAFFTVGIIFVLVGIINYFRLNQKFNHQVKQ